MVPGGQSTLRVSAEVPGGAPWVPRAEHTAQPGAPCPAGLGQQDWHLAYWPLASRFASDSIMQIIGADIMGKYYHFFHKK